MSEPQQDQQRLVKFRNFLDLMPLTLALAGLPESETGKFFTPEQMESRAISVKNAFRIARRTVKEILEQ